ncbi:MAG: DUF2798 domain-containing protein [Clostridium sp.]|nr:DUF2798 domain-containing protein [Clostridium sp.]
MGKNKKEHFIFVLIIASLMVYIMSCYNMIIMDGFSVGIFKDAIIHFLPAIAFALIGDLFIIGNIVKRLVPKIVKDENNFKKKVICISVLTCCGMVLWMTIFGTFMNIGFGPDFLPAYGIGIVKNFIFALPLNLLIVGPIARALFFKLFPA